MIFKRLRQRLRDIATTNTLCDLAMRKANEQGEEAPGAEHLLLSAIELSDGTARRMFERVGADARELPEAINKQYVDALQGVGVDAYSSGLQIAPEPITPTRIFFDSKAPAQSLMKKIYEVHDKSLPFLSLHVVAAVASMERGVAARALAAMGVSRKRLRAAVVEELEQFQS